MSAEALPRALLNLAEGGSLSASESAEAFDVLMSGHAPAAQIAALLMALRIKGETADEVSGAVQSMRRVMLRLDCDDPDTLVDTCGTGGGSPKTFNISTAAALLAAGAGVRIAKHGNRSFTSRSGSADVLEALGIAVDLTPEVMAKALRSAGIVFMFAPVMHPAMRHVGPVRRELGLPTIMNILGPLANPAGVQRQVIGVADASRLTLIAGALAQLGTIHSLVVHGEPGMDEISPVGRTRVAEVRRGAETTDWEISPTQLGLYGMIESDLSGGSPEENAMIILDVLAGRGNPTATAAVTMNAAAAIYLSGAEKSFNDSYSRATAALKANRGTFALEQLRAAQGKQ